MAASRASGSDLATWAMAQLNNAAETALDDCAAPAWAKSLSNRTAQCLISEGFASKKDVSAAFTAPDFNWQSIQNFGRKNNDEVLAWLSK